MTDEREPLLPWTLKGTGESCPRCKRPMERRQRERPPAWFNGYWHAEWDHCGVCPYQVFYPCFKRRQDYLANGRRHRVVLDSRARGARCQAATVYSSIGI